MVAASGQLSLPLDYLRNSVAASSAFQGWTSTVDQATALARVHLVADTGLVKPSAWVEWNTGWERERIAYPNTFVGSGTILLGFRADVVSADLDDEAKVFTNKIGAILSEIEALSGTALYLDVTRITLADGPYRPAEDEATSSTDYWTILFDVEFVSA